MHGQQNMKIVILNSQYHFDHRMDLFLSDYR